MFSVQPEIRFWLDLSTSASACLAILYELLAGNQVNLVHYAIYNELKFSILISELFWTTALLSICATWSLATATCDNDCNRRQQRRQSQRQGHHEPSNALRRCQGGGQWSRRRGPTRVVKKRTAGRGGGFRGEGNSINTIETHIIVPIDLARFNFLILIHYCRWISNLIHFITWHLTIYRNLNIWPSVETLRFLHMISFELVLRIWRGQRRTSGGHGDCSWGLSAIQSLLFWQLIFRWKIITMQILQQHEHLAVAYQAFPLISFFLSVELQNHALLLCPRGRKTFQYVFHPGNAMMKSFVLTPLLFCCSPK